MEVHNDFTLEGWVELVHDLEPVEVSEVDVKKLKDEHGDRCDVGTG